MKLKNPKFTIEKMFDYDFEDKKDIVKPQTLDEMERESKRQLDYVNDRTKKAIKKMMKQNYKPSLLSSLINNKEFINNIKPKLFFSINDPREICRRVIS